MSDGSDFRFVVEDDDGNRNVVPVALGTIRVGRQADNEVCLPERNVSRRHAKVELSADGPSVVTDLGSYNGVYINGQRIAGTGVLNPGDALRIGDFQLELRGQAGRREGANAALAPLGREVTQPEGMGERARSMAEEPTRPTEPPALPVERTDVSGAPAELFAAPIEPTAPSELADVPTVRHDIERPESTDPGLGPDGSDTDIRAPFAHLLCLSGERAGTPFALTKAKLVIGRTEENDIALPHRSISREHTSIEWTSPYFHAVDLESSNGTLLNGDSVQQAKLHHGDVLELGQIRLRFVGQGQPCVLSAEERAAVARELKRGQRSWRHSGRAAAAGIALLLAAGGGVAVYRGSLSQGEPLPVAAKALAGPPLDEATSLIAQAQAALATHGYARAQALASAALAIDGNRRDAQLLIHQADTEEHARQILEAANAAINAHAYADAFNALQELPKQSGHAAEAQGLLAQIRPPLMAERTDEFLAALASGDVDEGALLLDELTALSPADGNLGELRRQLDAARRRTERGGKERHSKAPTPANKERTSAKEERPAPPTTSRALHVARAHHEAQIRTGGGEPNPAAAKSAYADGTKLLAANQVSRAIDSFQRCIAADHNYAMCYRALGIAYAKAQNGPKAVHFYRLYLKVDPAAQDAGQVRALLQSYAAQAPQ